MYQCYEPLSVLCNTRILDPIHGNSPPNYFSTNARSTTRGHFQSETPRKNLPPFVLLCRKISWPLVSQEFSASRHRFRYCTNQSLPRNSNCRHRISNPWVEPAEPSVTIFVLPNMSPSMVNVIGNHGSGTCLPPVSCCNSTPNFANSKRHSSIASIFLAHSGGLDNSAALSHERRPVQMRCTSSLLAINRQVTLFSLLFSRLVTMSWFF